MEIVRVVREELLRSWNRLRLIEIEKRIDQAASQRDVWEKEKRVANVELHL